MATKKTRIGSAKQIKAKRAAAKKAARPARKKAPVDPKKLEGIHLSGNRNTGFQVYTFSKDLLSTGTKSHARREGAYSSILREAEIYAEGFSLNSMKVMAYVHDHTTDQYRRIAIARSANRKSFTVAVIPQA